MGKKKGKERDSWRVRESEKEMGVTEEERVDGFENEDSLRGASQV